MLIRCNIYGVDNILTPVLNCTFSVMAQIASFPHKLEIPYRDDVIFPCQAVGDPAPVVSWRKGLVLVSIIHHNYHHRRRRHRRRHIHHHHHLSWSPALSLIEFYPCNEFVLLTQYIYTSVFMYNIYIYIYKHMYLCRNIQPSFVSTRPIFPTYSQYNISWTDLCYF